jgi:hypothetical protein
VVRTVWRHKTKQVGIEFTDGTRLFIDGHTNSDIEISITVDTSPTRTESR